MSEREVDLIVARLRTELQRSGAASDWADERGSAWNVRAEAERFAHVTLDRPLLYKPGAWGRIRGTLLAPLKLVLRKLIRWYVEPALAQQRDFNATILVALERLNERVDALNVEVSRSERRPPDRP